ncbi:Myo-inositol 2-dehydrogenase [subsurface metagenome]
MGITTLHGANSVNVGKKFGFKYATADYKEIINDKNINTIFILTRHNLHADLVVEGLEKDKNVYVEKPLALNMEEIEKIKKSLSKSKGRLMVGFNRRFSPHSIKLKDFIGKEHGPIIMNFRVNAGQLPADHWLSDPDIGGGRIIGEGCHFIDFLRFLSDSCIKNLTAKSNFEKDNKVIEIEFTDGSIGTILYATIGDRTFPKERVEVFVDGKVGIIDDFRKTILSVNGKKAYFKTKTQDKGHTNEINLFIESVVQGTKTPIPPGELIEVSEWTIKADRL